MNRGIRSRVIKNARKVDPRMRDRFLTNSDMVLKVSYQIYALNVQSIRTLVSVNLAGLFSTTVIISFPLSFSAIPTIHRPAFSVCPVLRPLMFK